MKHWHTLGLLAFGIVLGYLLGNLMPFEATFVGYTRGPDRIPSRFEEFLWQIHTPSETTAIPVYMPTYEPQTSPNYLPATAVPAMMTPPIPSTNVPPQP